MVIIIFLSFSKPSEQGNFHSRPDPGRFLRGEPLTGALSGEGISCISKTGGCYKVGPMGPTRPTRPTYWFVAAAALVGMSMSITSITILQRHHQQHYKHCQHHHPTHLPAQPIQRILHHILLKVVPGLYCIGL